MHVCIYNKFNYASNGTFSKDNDSWAFDNTFMNVAIQNSYRLLYF